MIRAQYATNKLSLPVSGVSYVGFEHVQGVPNQGSAEGFSVYRLKLLDLMIERLSSGYADQAARAELAAVTSRLREGDPALAETLVSDSDGSTRSFLMNVLA